MNIVVSGSRIQIYGESVQTYRELPLGNYDVCFNPMSGFYLTPRHELEVREEKIYGDHEKKVAKVMRSFEAADRNFGIILSGQKGIGKSLFARVLANTCIDNNIPVVTVQAYIPGIADFLSSIEQEICVIFDEFEKTFGETEDGRPQEEMLPLFDGLDSGKKLFVITCNEVNRLNSYLLNRPGRFHYHFTLDVPTPEEVEQYMTDKLLPQHHVNIPRIVNFSRTINMTYDYLRAIAFELNQGYSLEETLGDLNISRTTDLSFNCILTLANGKEYRSYGEKIDLYGQKDRRMRLYSSEDNSSILISYDPRNIITNQTELCVDPKNIRIIVDPDDYWDIEDRAEREKAVDAARNVPIRSFILQKYIYDNSYRYLV